MLAKMLGNGMRGQSKSGQQVKRILERETASSGQVARRTIPENMFQGVPARNSLIAQERISMASAKLPCSLPDLVQMVLIKILSRVLEE